MIRASALLYTLLVTVLLAALLSSVLLAAQNRSMHTEAWSAFNACRSNVLSGMALPLARNASLLEEWDSLALAPGSDEYLATRSSAWGLFDVRACRAQKAGERYERIALLGMAMPDKVQTLYLADHGEPVSLAGMTSLAGTCSLPRAGLRRAYIEGKPYNGDVVLPDQRVSGSAIPVLPERVEARLRLFAGIIRNGSLVDGSVDRVEEVLHGRFAEQAIVLDAGGQRTLPVRELSGHIIIIAHDSLVIPAAARLSGVLVCAPHVTIEAGFEGDLQCFTEHGVVVGEGASLRYPSTLVCTPPDTLRHAAITLGRGVRFVGTLLGCSGYSGATGRTLVELGEEVHFMGEIWNDGPVQLRGECKGSIVAERLVVRTPSSTYRDHLLDVRIEPLVATVFACAGIGGDTSTAMILKWLDR